MQSESEISLKDRISVTEERWRGLMLASRQGDKAAYRMLLDELSRFIRQIARRSAANAQLSGADVEDIVQETLLAIHLKSHTWNENELLGPWVRAITRYKSIDILRRRGGRLHVPIDDYSEELAADSDETQLPARDIIRMATILPERQKSIVVAMFVDGLSTGEAAARFAMTEGAVRVNVHRALAALAKKFGDKG
ncbi:MAG: sigma-70 family RNA polymerase sigma factor [Hyphomicrobiales bacterium]|nr:sigma-70 family RNA polymerase sigma factor [Hyphomicrobiales bacterium]